jgi:3-oxoacyl-[acyl-carrier-protein] synthase II
VNVSPHIGFGVSPKAVGGVTPGTRPAIVALVCSGIDQWPIANCIWEICVYTRNVVYRDGHRVLLLCIVAAGRLHSQDPAITPMSSNSVARVAEGRRVIISGIGIVAPNGLTASEFWRNTVEGVSGIRRIRAFDPSEYPCKIAGEVVGFDPAGYFRDAKSVKRSERFEQFAVAASKMALGDANIDFERVDRDRFGVSIGTGIGGLESMERSARRLIEKGPSRISPFAITGMMGNAASAHVSQEFGLRGPNICIVTACATSANSIGEAWRSIRCGDADIFLAGGCEATITPLGVAGFSAMKALSMRNDEPEKASRPFDKHRDGFVMGEGGGVLVIEELEHARRRSAPIYCELAGYGCTADAHHMTQPHPEGREVARAMSIAMRHAKVDACDLDYINAHATSTPIGDIFETRAIKLALGADAFRVAISSTKSMTGHLLGAAGSVELAVCAFSVKDGVIPPTINLEDPDPECDLDYVPKTAREKKVRVAMNNSFGFGGHNVSLVVRAFSS